MSYVMVWYGMVGYVMVLFRMAWQGMARNDGTVWCGIVCRTLCVRVMVSIVKFGKVCNGTYNIQ